MQFLSGVFYESALYLHVLVARGNKTCLGLKMLINYQNIIAEKNMFKLLRRG